MSDNEGVLAQYSAVFRRIPKSVKVLNAILQQRTFGPYMQLSVAGVQKVERDQKKGAKPKKVIMPGAG